MTLRKGQHLYNELMKLHKFTSWQVIDKSAVRQITDTPTGKQAPDIFSDVELHQVLFYLSDKDHDEIMARLKHE